MALLQGNTATEGLVMIKFTVSCAMTLCSLVHGYQQWEHNAPSSIWIDGWMQYVPPEC